MILQRIGLHAEGRRLPVDRNASGKNEFFSGSARSDACLCNYFLNALFHKPSFKKKARRGGVVAPVRDASPVNGEYG
jgi:hypothetical protein